MEEDILSVILGGSIILILILSFLVIALIAVYIVALWKLFTKAGEKGWKAIIPFYSTYTMVQIAGLNWWYFLIAISGTIFSILNIDGLDTVTNIASLAVNFFIFYNLAKKFKQEPVGYAIASIFVEPIIVMMFGFSSKYVYDNTVAVSPNGPIGEDKKNNTTNNTSNEQEKYCLGCGQKLTPDVKFCENCGKEVK